MADAIVLRLDGKSRPLRTARDAARKPRPAARAKSKAKARAKPAKKRGASGTRRPRAS
jgi:hypothetical protein